MIRRRECMKFQFRIGSVSATRVVPRRTPAADVLHARTTHKMNTSKTLWVRIRDSRSYLGNLFGMSSGPAPTVSSTLKPSLSRTGTAALPSKNRLPHKNWDPLACSYLLSILRNHDVTIRGCGRGDGS